MAKVFISHSSSDKAFVNLLVKILDFHHIDNWYDSSNILPGSNFSKEIEDALNGSESLIIVISKNSLQSEWVRREVIYFQATKPNSIIPILLDETNPSDLCRLTPGFEQYQSINFNKCMLAGYEKLMAHFDREFLPDFDRRTKSDRRDNLDRRQNNDRRKAKIDQRMRVGFWKAYENSTGIGKFELLNMGLSEQSKMLIALNEEVIKYSYSVQGKLQEADKILAEAVIHAPDRLREVNMDYKAIYVIEAVVENILKNYQVEEIIRRDEGGRRDETHRREIRT